MEKKLLQMLAVEFVFFPFSSIVMAEIRYTVTDLGTLGGNNSVAYSINNLGQIVGVARDSSGRNAACLFDSSGFGININLAVSDSPQDTAAYSINNRGQIVGTAEGRATLFDSSGNKNNICLQPTNPVWGMAFSINNGGQIVGFAQFSTRDTAYRFDPSGNGQNVTLMTSDISSRAYSINDNGQIVGITDDLGSAAYPQACRFTGTGQYINLGPVGSDARSINNNGQVVGGILDTAGFKACFFDFSGNWNNINLGSLGGTSSFAYSINNKGQIVGYADYTPPRVGGCAACLFDSSGNGNNIDLNSVIAPSSGWNLGIAYCINDNGWIVGSGVNPQGQQHAFLLTPVPQPAILSLNSNASCINTLSPGDSSVSVNLTASQLGGDALDTAILDFGDGTSTDLSLPLPATVSHDYSLTSGDNSRTFTASASAYNSGGVGSATTNITVFRQPDIVLSVNGVSAEDNSIIQVNVVKYPVLNLSLLDSLGFIENAQFQIPSKGLNISGPDLTYSDVVFNQSDIGKVFPLLTRISNTGCGVNSDSMNVSLRIVGIPGDANLDQRVDVGDLGILAANYGKIGNCTWAMGDFNGDGNVDCGDLGILAANYGTGTSGADYNADYAKVFGTTTKSDVDTGKTESTTDENTSSSVCSGMGLPLVMCILLTSLLLGNSLKSKE
jgi:uncharacterized membrane protein